MAKDMTIQVYDDQVKTYEEHEEEIGELIQRLLDNPEKINKILEAN